MKYDNSDDARRRTEGMYGLYNNRLVKVRTVSPSNTTVGGVCARVFYIGDVVEEEVDIHNVNMQNFQFGNSVVYDEESRAYFSVYTYRLPRRTTRQGIHPDFIGISVPKVRSDLLRRIGSGSVFTKDFSDVLLGKAVYDRDRSMYMSSLEAEEFDRDSVFPYALSSTISLMASRETPGTVITYYKGSDPIGHLEDERIVLNNKSLHLREHIERQELRVA